MDNLLLHTIDWLPLFIWLILCFFGIRYGFKEIRECHEDIRNVDIENDSLKFIVATGNIKAATRNISIQVIFIITAFFTMYFKYQELPGVHVESIVRAIIVPAFFITAELLTILNLREQGQTRKRVKAKLIDRKFRGSANE
jgi:hypothetical protein